MVYESIPSLLSSAGKVHITYYIKFFLEISLNRAKIGTRGWGGVRRRGNGERKGRKGGLERA